ncbi:hypothetical protein [Thermosulfuriphilus ammonigenes]|nr:hypothetical protein [Thermosulfuriphilus ammonigenes]
MAQKTRESLYGNLAVEDTDAQVPEERAGLREPDPLIKKSWIEFSG